MDKQLKFMKTKDYYIGRLQVLQSSKDWEAATCIAHDLMCEFLSEIGHKDVANEFRKIVK
jgi:hypothetical protein